MRPVTITSFNIGENLEIFVVLGKPLHRDKGALHVEADAIATASPKFTSSSSKGACVHVLYDALLAFASCDQFAQCPVCNCNVWFQVSVSVSNEYLGIFGV